MTTTVSPESKWRRGQRGRWGAGPEGQLRGGFYLRSWEISTGEGGCSHRPCGSVQISVFCRLLFLEKKTVAFIRSSEMLCPQTASKRRVRGFREHSLGSGVAVEWSFTGSPGGEPCSMARCCVNICDLPLACLIRLPASPHSS